MRCKTKVLIIYSSCGQNLFYFTAGFILMYIGRTMSDTALIAEHCRRRRGDRLKKTTLKFRMVQNPMRSTLVRWSWLFIGPDLPLMHCKAFVGVPDTAKSKNEEKLGITVIDVFNQSVESIRETALFCSWKSRQLTTQLTYHWSASKLQSLNGVISDSLSAATKC